MTSHDSREEVTEDFVPYPKVSKTFERILQSCSPISSKENLSDLDESNHKGSTMWVGAELNESN